MSIRRQFYRGVSADSKKKNRYSGCVGIDGSGIGISGTFYAEHKNGSCRKRIYCRGN